MLRCKSKKQGKKTKDEICICFRVRDPFELRHANADGEVLKNAGIDEQRKKMKMKRKKKGWKEKTKLGQRK